MTDNGPGREAIKNDAHVEAALDEWMTVDEVASWLRVSKSWIYEHTRSRGATQAERLPYVTLRKYLRFERRQVRVFLDRRLSRS